jgi:hypothetical protein
MPTAELRKLVDWYANDWGPVDWKGLKASEFKCEDQEMGQMLYALSLIEADSQTMRRKLSAAGADRSEELLEFIAIWLAEEGEHARALAHMSAMHGFEPRQMETRSVVRDLRAFITWPSLYLARGMRGICASYCTLGSMQELVALTTYHHLAKVSKDAEVSRVLKAIARQESHHMKFYRNAAALFLEDYKPAQRNTRLLIRRLWRPPGMDLLGDGDYEKVFGPILNDPSYATNLLRVDRVVGALPGMEEVSVMADYLDSQGFRYDATAVLDEDE